MFYQMIEPMKASKNVRPEPKFHIFGLSPTIYQAQEIMGSGLKSGGPASPQLHAWLLVYLYKVSQRFFLVLYSTIVSIKFPI